MDCNPPGSFVHGDSLGKNTGGGLPCPPPEDLPNSGIEPRSPALQTDSLPAEQPGKSHQVTVYFKQPLEGSHANFLPNAEMSSKTPLKHGN